MKTTQCALVALFVLILIHFISCSRVSISSETRSNLINRFQPRKLLAHVSSLSVSLDKLKIAYEASQKSVGTSLRKAPPSNSNPIQNKWLWCHLSGDLKWKEKLNLIFSSFLQFCPANYWLGRKAGFATMIKLFT